MTESEIATILLENTGKTVRVILSGGVTAVLAIDNVDGEGCTCRILEHPDMIQYDPALEYWFCFDEIVDIPKP